MKLQKQTSRKVGDTEYVKWVVVLPAKLVKKIGWQNGTDVSAKIEKGKIILQKML